jgi:hypothetical protein
MTITGKPTAAEGQPGRLPLTSWQLSAAPTRGWAEDFGLAGGFKSGSGLYQSTDPKVNGFLVQWEVPKDDLVDAHRHVIERVEKANVLYRERLARDQARLDRDNATRAQQTAAAAEHQAVLDRLE